MDLFQTFQQRAQEALNAASELASEVGTDALGTAQTFVAAVRSDATAIASDATRSAGRRRDAASASSSHVEFSEDVLSFVQSLTYASFDDNDTAASSRTDAALDPWQVQHATAMLQQSPELEQLRFALCPKRMSEQRFWCVYFSLVADVLERYPATTTSAHTDAACAPDGGSPPAAVQPSHATSHSGLSAWEDLGPVMSDVRAAGGTGTDAAGRSEATGGDDLDDYLKGMLDGEDLPPAASGDDADDGDIDAYLDALDADDDADTASGGNGTGEGGHGGRAPDEDDVAKYLGDLDVDDDVESGLTS